MNTGVWLRDHLLGIHTLYWFLAVHYRRAERESCCLPGPAAGHLPLLTAPAIPLLPPVWLLSSGMGLEAWDVCSENAANACELIWILLTRTRVLPRAIARQLRELKFLPLSKNLPPNCVAR